MRDVLQQRQLAVVILNTATFDATTVDALTVTLASAPVRLNGKGKPMALTPA